MDNAPTVSERAVASDIDVDHLKKEMADWTKEAEEEIICPACNASGALVRDGWCVLCTDCGWCPCSRR